MRFVLPFSGAIFIIREAVPRFEANKLHFFGRFTPEKDVFEIFKRREGNSAVSREFSESEGVGFDIIKAN